LERTSDFTANEHSSGSALDADAATHNDARKSPMASSGNFPHAQNLLLDRWDALSQ